MRTTSVAILHHRTSIDTLVALYRKNARLFYPMYTRKDTTNNAIDKIATEGTFGAPGVVNEGTSIPEVDFRNPFYMDVQPLMYAQIFSASNRAIETDRTGMITRKISKLLRSADKAKESLCADFMNLATSTANPTPDGLALASASHLYSGGTASNVVTGNVVLSATGLETGLQEMFTQVDDSGDPMQFSGKKTLIVHPSNYARAMRLTGAAKMPETSNNDPNWAGSMIANVVQLPYMDSTTAWALVEQGSDNPLVFLEGRGTKVESDEEFRKDGMSWKVTSIFTRYPQDWRGFIYSAGA